MSRRAIGGNFSSLMPDGSGRIRGISVPEVPWHQSKPQTSAHDRRLALRMRDPEYRAAYELARAEIAAESPRGQTLDERLLDNAVHDVRHPLTLPHYRKES